MAAGLRLTMTIAPRTRFPGLTLVLHALRVNGSAVRLEIAVQAPPEPSGCGSILTLSAKST